MNNDFQQESITTSSTSSSSYQWVFFLVILLFSILVFFYLYEYYNNISIITSIDNYFSMQPIVNVDVKTTTPSEGDESVAIIPSRKEVFNIPGNNYTYNEAKAVCKAYGGDLASYEQIEKAYHHGGEWNSYGWSDQQMVFFPTQKESYDQLQKTEKDKHSLGRPGINGGYIADAEATFGVNCYAMKPKITQEEDELMQSDFLYPKSQEDLDLEKDVEKYKANLNNILVSPFNKTQWSKI